MMVLTEEQLPWDVAFIRNELGSISQLPGDLLEMLPSLGFKKKKKSSLRKTEKQALVYYN